MLQPDHRAHDARVVRHLHGALGDVLCQVAGAFKIARDMNRGHQFAQIDRHGLAPGDSLHHLVLDFALKRIESWITDHNALGELHVEPAERVHRVNEHLFCDAAHLGDFRPDEVEFGVVSLDCMFAHDCLPYAQPKRPVI